MSNALETLRQKADARINDTHALEPVNRLVDEMVEEGLKKRAAILKAAIDLRKELQTLNNKTRPDNVRLVAVAGQEKPERHEEWTPEGWKKKENLGAAIENLEKALEPVLAGPEKPDTKREEGETDEALDQRHLAALTAAGKAYSVAYEELEKVSNKIKGQLKDLGGKAD